jgi:hypothetical protein
VTPPQPGARGLAGLFRRHPVMTSTVLVCALLGAALGGVFLPEEWSLVRRLVAGALAGAGTGMLMTGTKWIG